MQCLKPAGAAPVCEVANCFAMKCAGGGETAGAQEMRQNRTERKRAQRQQRKQVRPAYKPGETQQQSAQCNCVSMRRRANLVPGVLRRRGNENPDPEAENLCVNQQRRKNQELAAGAGKWCELRTAEPQLRRSCGGESACVESRETAGGTVRRCAAAAKCARKVGAKLNRRAVKRE